MICCFPERTLKNEQYFANCTGCWIATNHGQWKGTKMSAKSAYEIPFIDVIPMSDWKNKLYYGDNLDTLRKYIRDETVDLCYIDPPFNSKRNYNQIYNNIGKEDKAQARAFIDTWTWDEEADRGYEEIISNYNKVFTKQSINLIIGLERVLTKGSLLAYLISMT